MRYALLDLPLARHRLAFKAAQAATCAGEQGKYWEMHERLFENQRQLTPWSTHAEAIGLDPRRFEDCLESGRFAEEIRGDMSVAKRLGATGTPSFVVALTDAEDPAKVKGVSFIRGAKPFATFKAQIDQALENLDR